MAKKLPGPVWIGRFLKNKEDKDFFIIVRVLKTQFWSKDNLIRTCNYSSIPSRTRQIPENQLIEPLC